MSGVTPARTPYQSDAPRLGLVAPLDGLRGISVLLIMVVHLLFDKAGSFAAAVDVFFAVSGFLITTLLLQEHRSTGTISLRAFYIRRGLRLLPALYVVLLATVASAAFIEGGKYFRSVVKEALAAFFYVYHVFYVTGAGVAKGESPKFLVHLWTLSVEEHFYVIIALLMVVLITRNWVRPFALAAVAFILMAAAFRLANQPGPLNFWLQRPDSLLVGVVAAIVNSRIPDPLTERQRRLIKGAGWFALVVAGVTFLASTSIFNKLGIAVKFSDLPAFQPTEDGARLLGEPRFGLTWIQWGFTAVGWATGVMALTVVRCPEWLPARIMSLRWLTWTGRMSYPIYLWHIPVFITVASVFGERVPVPVLLVMLLGTTFGLAVLTNRYVERPALARKDRFVRDPTAVKWTSAPPAEAAEAGAPAAAPATAAPGAGAPPA